MPHLGIAVATSLGGWLNAWLLWSRLSRSGEFVADRRLTRTLPRIVLSSAIMGIAIWLLAAWLAPYFEPRHGLLVRFGALALLVGVGGLVFALTAQLVGALRLRALLAGMRRQ